MNNYFSRLATRSGLLNSPQGAAPAIVPTFQKGSLVSPHQLEIQTEHAMVETAEPVKSDAQPIMHTSTHVKSAQSLPSSSHREDKIEMFDSDAMFEHSSQSEIQNPIEKNETRFIERNSVVISEHLGSDSVGGALPTAESQQADTGSQPIVAVADSALQVSHSDVTQADRSGSIDKNRAGVIGATARNGNNISPSKNEWSNVDRVKTDQRGQPDSDPLTRVLEAHKTIRNDSKPSSQHGQMVAEQPFREHPVQPSQINIQSITLEVHQAEPVRTPAPAPAPRHHAPAPKQNPPSQTRLSRYYLKGW